MAVCLLGVGRSVAKVSTWAEGSWSWFGDPRAVHVGGASGDTFVGWIDWAGNVTVGFYDRRLGLRRTAVVGRAYHDDHSNPSILVEADGRITVFWSEHNGPQMYYRTTELPGDITSWAPVSGVRQQIAGTGGFTYPNPVMLPGEDDRVYLFWRGADWSFDYATRGGSGWWSAAREVVEVRGQRPYAKVATDGADRIAIAFTDGHPRNVLSSVYYPTYRHGSLWTADGNGSDRSPMDRSLLSRRRSSTTPDVHMHPPGCGMSRSRDEDGR